MSVKVKIVLVSTAAALLTCLPLDDTYAQASASQSRATQDATSSPFRDVPSDSWAYKAIVRLINHNRMSGYGNGEGGLYPPFPERKQLSVYQAAVLITRGVDVCKLGTKTVEAFRQMSLQERLVYLEDTSLLRKLLPEFAVELRTLGVDLLLAQRQLDRLEQEVRAADPPFPDVAPTHWASASVERLRQEGVLVGYPDGTFLSGRSEEKEEGKRK